MSTHINILQKRQFSQSLNRKSSLTRNLGQLLRCCMSRNLATSFTTVKAMAGKHVLSDTKLYKCFKGKLIALSQ